MKTAGVLSAVVIGTGLGLLACKVRNNAADTTATPANRRVLGPASPALAIPPFDPQRLANDMAYRRQVGWQLAYTALAPAPVRNVSLATAYEPGQATTIPRWMTWYDGFELSELFDMLYGSPQFGNEQGLSARDARKRALAFSDQQLSRIFVAHSDKAILGWTEERLAQELGKIKDLKNLHGLVTGQDGLPNDAGHGMTVFSPQLITHVLRNYARITDCYKAREDLTFATRPPHADENFTVCLDAEFPGATAQNTSSEPPNVAMAIKATWQKVRSTSGSINPLPVYKHDAESLAAALRSGDWTNTSKTATPTPQQIFTVRVGDDKTYMLTGLHVMSKQSRHWIWVSLWWAEDPNEDFGADRPASIAELGHGLENYKMCVVTDFDEHDPAPWRSYLTPPPLPELSAEDNRLRARRLHGLGQSLKASHDFATAARPGGTAPSWCSNPYIELGHGNNRTNCIGCHQHAGSDLTGSESIDDQANYPASGRTPLRENFPTDYLWSVSQPPDDFSGRLGEIRAKYVEE